MRYYLILALLLPASALAWEYNDAPLIVVGQNSKAPTTNPAAVSAADIGKAPNFPEWAITNAAQNTAGNTNPMPNPAPASPTPASPRTPAGSAATAAPHAPATPPSPISKLWPRDTVPIFMKSCIGFHIELVPGCGCTITNLMLAMPHDEFLAKSADGSIEQDPRLAKIREQCIATPKRAE